MHALSKENQTEVKVKGKSLWVPAIPYPFYTTKGLPFWKRLNESNWLLQCECGQIFNTQEDYEAHMVYMNSPYATAKPVSRVIL
jgi:hypothetical protein